MRRTRMFACIVLGSCLLFCSPDTFGEDYSPYTPEQLSETYRSLPIQDRKELDRLSSERRKNELTEKRRVLGILERSGHPPFKMDQLLRDAYEYHEYHEYHEDWENRDRENRDRETCIALFNKYIEKEPKSQFLPDIYELIGGHYGSTISTRHGEKSDRENEKSDREKRDKYFMMAHQIWGETYSLNNQIVWGNLACAEGSSREVRRTYYDWLLLLRKADSPKICYPYAGLERCYRGGSFEYTDDEVLVRFKWLKENIDFWIQVAEKYFLNSSTPEDLKFWATEYPNTKLGERAAETIKGAGNHETEKTE